MIEASRQKLLKGLAIVLGLVVIVLLGLLIFVKPVSGPTITIPGNGIVTQSTTSPDGRVAITLPHASDAISSPVAIEGTVTGGGWFFEASFPIKILDSAGNVIGTGHAQALSDWTATGTVPFSASIAFTAPSTAVASANATANSTNDATGTIVFSKDNPSGAPQNAQSFSIPVSFE